MTANPTVNPSWIELKLSLERLYQRQPDEVFGALQKDLLPTFTGKFSREVRLVDPLDAVFVYSDNNYPGFWHYITFGMSDLYRKDGVGGGVSGFGFELSFRVLKEKDEKDSPHWPVKFLQNLCRHAFKTGNPYNSGHHMSLNGPILTGVPDVTITAVAFTIDKQLAPVETTSGSQHFAGCRFNN